nr:signal recognition particle 14 kDa protein [Chlorocebus sabaeus]
MVLLESEQFLTELTRLFQKCWTSGSVYITLKKYDGRTKPIPKKGTVEGFEPADNKCLLRATDGKKKISTVVSSKEVNKFQMVYSNLLRANMDGLKKRDKKNKTKKTKAAAAAATAAAAPAAAATTATAATAATAATPTATAATEIVSRWKREPPRPHRCPGPTHHLLLPPASSGSEQKRRLRRCYRRPGSKAGPGTARPRRRRTAAGAPGHSPVRAQRQVRGGRATCAGEAGGRGEK